MSKIVSAKAAPAEQRAASTPRASTMRLLPALPAAERLTRGVRKRSHTAPPAAATDMTDPILEALLDARRAGIRCALVTVAATTGSVPREPGAKMLVCANGNIVGTIGGGKFEALVIGRCAYVMELRSPVLQTYPLHDGSEASFGAICDGHVTVLIEPYVAAHSIYLVGAGHCARAVAQPAQGCGWHVTVIDDRTEILSHFPADVHLSKCTPAEFIADHAWRPEEALVI